MNLKFDWIGNDSCIDCIVNGMTIGFIQCFLYKKKYRRICSFRLKNKDIPWTYSNDKQSAMRYIERKFIEWLNEIIGDLS